MRGQIGNCSKCGLMKARIYHLEPNPSVTWAIDPATVSAVPGPVIQLCADCLSVEQLLAVSAPVALFVLNELRNRETDKTYLLSVPGDVEYLTAWLICRSGCMAFDTNFENAARQLLT